MTSSAIGNVTPSVFRRFEVDDELHFCCLMHWQIAGGSPLSIRPVVNAGLPKRIGLVGSVAHQPAGFCVHAVGVDRGQLVTAG